MILMPRLRDIHTGAVVSVSDETAARLDGEWESADKPAPKKSVPVTKAPTKRAARKPAVKRTVAKAAAASKTEK